jgi:hypothetical protein
MSLELIAHLLAMENAMCAGWQIHGMLKPSQVETHSSYRQIAPFSEWQSTREVNFGLGEFSLGTAVYNVYDGSNRGNENLVSISTKTDRTIQKL